ncbi:hypothetical protein [Tabrizicola sp.]|jgi:hypothetical protein|uniref:hypothetical protein n=1 Tax=Tabrizicola sp. TaxID=2005166 RepID=UPI003D2DE389
MPSILILALPVVVYLSLCRLPRAPGTLYTIGIMFLLAQAIGWLGLGGPQVAPLLTLAQVGIVLAGLVQGLRLLALPDTASRNRYLALVVGGLLIGAAVLNSIMGG